MKKINHDEISVLKRIVLIEKSYYFKKGDTVRINTKIIEPYYYWREFKESLGTVFSCDKEWNEVTILWFTTNDRVGLPSLWDSFNLIRVDKD
nr:hypothetical protein [uncultured archaeon]